jgi:NitT/TauT family transport system ATP-binding protein
MPRAERGDIFAREKLMNIQAELWSLVRSEAIDAEREVQHA